MDAFASAPVGELSATSDRIGVVSGPALDNRRVLSGIIDLVVVAAGVAVIFAVAGAVGGGETEVTPALAVLAVGWALYYYFALESGNGQTLGKRALGLRVLSADGGPASMREIAVRTVLRVIDGIGFYVVGLIAMLATGERRQRLGDLAAGTIIADARVTTGGQTWETAVAAATAAPSAPVEVDEPAEPEEPDAPEEPVGEPVVLKPVETVSAMDVVMGGSQASEGPQAPRQDLDEPA